MWQERREIRPAVGPTALIGFAGDALLGFPGERAVFVQPELQTLVRECDEFFINQEGALTNAPPAPGKSHTFRVAPKEIRQVTALGATGVSLANNHVLDHGPEGVSQTLDVCREAGLRVLGAGQTREEAVQPLVMEHSAGTLALMAFFHCGERPPAKYPGPARMDEEETRDQIATLRAAGHVVGVIYHGGEEFFGIPWPRRRELLQRLIRAGAQLVIGHHAHVVQGWEVMDKEVIAYGLGNLYFNSPRHHILRGTDVGLVLGVEIDRQGPVAVRECFVRADRNAGRLNLLEQKEALRAIRQLRELSDVLAPKSYLRAWRHDCLMRVASRHLTSRPPERSRFDWFVLRVKLFLNFFRQAFRSTQGRDIVLAALRALPGWLTGRRFGGKPFGVSPDAKRNGPR
ncbi:MAG: CapA family protein [Phycisphaerae bacterium]|nr:CapA family protein [Phycisphaerae bacterium]